jgi:hypothetical protein
VAGAPLASAIAAHLAILRIPSEFPLAVLVAALQLAQFGRACSLLRVKSRWRELLLAKTATPLLHSFKVDSFSLKAIFNWERTASPPLGVCGSSIGRLSAT